MRLEDSHLHSEGGFWSEYLEILTDPAHFAAELTFTLLDILILSPLLFLLWSLMKRWVGKTLHREHMRLDLEHGHIHGEDDSISDRRS